MEIAQNITLHQYACTRLYCQYNAWYIWQSCMIKFKVIQSFVKKCSMAFNYLTVKKNFLILVMGSYKIVKYTMHCIGNTI
jgi:hypothetical protein